MENETVITCGVGAYSGGTLDVTFTIDKVTFSERIDYFVLRNHGRLYIHVDRDVLTPKAYKNWCVVTLGLVGKNIMLETSTGEPLTVMIIRSDEVAFVTPEYWGGYCALYGAQEIDGKVSLPVGEKTIEKLFGYPFTFTLV
jgi:hypothetical protein